MKFMRLIGIAVVSFLLSSVCLSQTQSSETAAAVDAGKAWIGARIIDGSGAPPIEKGTLFIRNGRIEAVGKKVKLPAGVTRIDATGKTIIPGLINAHGHVNSPEQLGFYLRDGITTVLSLGGDKEFALRKQCALAPAG